MRIVIDARITQDYKGGSAIYVINLIEALKKIDMENEYFYYANQRNNLLKGIDWWKTWAPLDNHVIGDPWEQFSLPIELARKSVDIYHATIGRLPALKFNAKYVLTVHDLSGIKFPQFAGSRRFILYTKAQLSHAVKRADKIIAVSESTKKDLIQLLGVEEKKIEVILEGVDKKYRVLNRSICSKVIKNKYDITKNYILAIGVFNPRKNLQRLFSAYQKLRSEGIDKILVVVGFKHWGHQEILESVKENIFLVEGVSEEELPYFYNSADLFVYPSLYEGFGLPLLEAMACGTPVAASNSSSIPEVVGNAALLFDPLNVKEIANTMINILKDTRLQQDMRDKGLERVKLFSWEKTAKETLALYKEVYEE